MKHPVVPAGKARSEITVLNSRFVATAAPAFSVEQAREFIAHVKHEFPDATHHVPAYVIGHGASVVAHCHDDGEPSGTAGRPTLAVVQGSGLGDIALVVARYFGGTKLGTGGLVRAYGDAARAVLEILPRAEKVLTHTVQVTLPYALFERTRLSIATHHGRLINAEFGENAVVTARFAVEAFLAFDSALQEISAGKAHPEIVETLVALVPI